MHWAWAGWVVELVDVERVWVSMVARTVVEAVNAVESPN